MSTLLKTETIPFYGQAGLHLCMRTPPKGVPLENVPDPFISVSRMDPTGRWLVGVIKSDLNQALLPVCLRVSRDTVSGEEEEGITNVKIERLWGQEHLLSRNIADYGRSVYRFSSFVSGTGKIKKNFPLLFCKRKRIFFSPVCSYCGRKLTECREDDLLAQVSLQPFSGSIRRYLYCPDCSPEGRFKPAFFAKELTEAERNNPLVTDRFGLMGLWSKLEQGTVDGQNFPCVVCDSFERCFPKEQEMGDAAKVLYPFSFYNFFASLRTFAPYNLEHVSDLLGGMPLEELFEMMKHARDEIGMRAVEDLRELTRYRSLYLFSNSEGSQLSASEIFALKLNLYLQIMKLVAAAWNVTKSPLIVINPENFGVSLLEGNQLIPVFWGFNPEPTYLTSTLYDHLFRAESTDARPDSILSGPLFSTRPEFLKVDPGSVGKKVYGNLLIDKCELVDSETKTRIWGSIRFSGPQALLEESGFIKVDLGFEQGFSRSLSVVFQVESVSSKEANLVSQSLSLGVDEIQQFQILASQPPFEVSFSFLPSYTISSDLYSMGLLGLRLFLCNSTQSLSDVVQKIESYKSEIKAKMPELNSSRSWREVFSNVDELVEVLNIRHIVYGKDEVEKLSFDLEEKTWDDFIGCILRMIFSSPGTGYLEAGESDYATIWNNIIEDLESLLRKALTWRAAPEEIAVPEKPREDEKKKLEIGKILHALLSDLSWLEPQKEVSVPPVRDTFEETLEKPVPPPPEPPVVELRDETPSIPEVPKAELKEEAPDETVTISAPPREKKAPEAPPPLPETEKKPEPVEEFPELEDLERTVVLPSALKRKKATPPPPREEIALEGKGEELGEKKKKKKEDEVFLDETIVIRKKPKKK